MRKRHSARLDLSVFDDHDSKLHKFINLTMLKGKKNIAYKHFVEMLISMKKHFKMPVKRKIVFMLKKISLPFKVSEVIIAKIRFKTPTYVKLSRAITIQYLNIIKCAEVRNDYSFFSKVSHEFIDYVKGVGASFKLFAALKHQIKVSKAHGRFKV
jgi:ribosomal protein S7